MQKSSGISRWWDWLAIAILFIMLLTAASRLVATNWTSFLYLAQTIVYIGFTVGVSLGYSNFSQRTSRWFSFLYMLVFLPLLWTLVIDQNTTLEEQFLSVFGRLFYSYADFFARRPVEDPFFFITLITLAFWVLGASAGFQLVRRQNYLAVVLPTAIGLLVIQSYDNLIAGRVWFIAFFAFMALLLLGRMNHLANRKSWRERRVFLSPDNSLDLSSIMAIAAGTIIFLSWLLPASVSNLDSAVKTWNRLTQPWHEFTMRMENSVTALKGPGRGSAGEFYGPELVLGRGFQLSDAIMFKVQAPELASAVKPPRYFWRGRTYDFYANGQWFTTGTRLEDYSPENSIPPAAAVGFEPARFVFNTGDATFSLLYAPEQPMWMSRKGSRFVFSADGGSEIVSWFAYPALLAGETYQVEAVLSNPNTRQLREAGLVYPAWVTDKYLQLPDDFSPRIKNLALDITEEAETPYDKAIAITKYLRDNIEYADTLPRIPRNHDLLEWMLFQNKQAYCVYYSSAEVLMLRSLGIPARLAVGFAQGEFNADQNEYTVRKENAHAWPEVYFPDVGWVEFEPTGNQLALNRPAATEVQLQNNPGDTNRLAPNDIAKPDTTLEEPTDEELNNDAQATQTVNLSLYLILLFIAFALLTVYLNRRYSFSARIPILLRTSFERSGVQIPTWVVNWERWVDITPIERSFESINFGLRLLDKPMPVDATPIERVKKLAAILPKAEIEIQTLLDEHQTSLYTSRVADVSRARKAALNIRLQALRERIRYLFEGKPIKPT